MNTTVAFTFALIVLARVLDVSLDTVRTAAIVQGRRMFAGVLGIFQALIFIIAVAKVLTNTDHPVYALAYGLGFGLGTYLGITIEQRLAYGHQLASLFTRKGTEMAQALGAAGYRLAQVQGQVQDGEVSILYVEVSRKRSQKLIQDAIAIDKTCFCIVNDVRSAGFIMRGIVK
jgi:uncharacterized protein YebE (UPF0316 family)